MMNFFFILLFSFIFFYTSIHKDTPTPHPKENKSTNLIALLDSGKPNSSIIVSTEGGESKVDKIGGYVELTDKNKAPSKVKIMSKEEINKRFGKLLKAMPEKPKSYILYLKSTKPIKLTKASKKTLKKAFISIKEKAPCIVDIIGHTDTVGGSKRNIKISLKRAQYIEKLVREENLSIITLNIKGYGEEDLLIPTADNVAEAKNRNIEIVIK